MINAKQQYARARCFSYLLDFVIVSVWTLSVAGAAHADVPDRLRLVSTVKKFDNTHLVSVAYEKNGFRWLRAHHVELSFGAITRSGEVRPFAAYGPVWRVETATSPWSAEFSVSPTLISNPRLGDRTLGGHVHFTLALAIGHRFGNGWELALRAQHISNSSLHQHNPGLDSIGIRVNKRAMQ